MNPRVAAARTPWVPGAVAALAILCWASRASASAAAADAAPPAPAIGTTRPAASTEDIRDIRGPQSLLSPWLLPALVAGGAVLAGGAYGLWRRRRRRLRARAPLPFEVALQRLEGVRALMQPHRAREFCIAVSDIVRSYIEHGFDLTATHRTTEEFLRDLLQLPESPLAGHRALLAEFLEQCDLVKFGDMSLSSQSMESLRHCAGDFVRATAAPAQFAQLRPAGRSHQHPQAHDSLPST